MYTMFTGYTVCTSSDYWNNSAHSGLFLLGSMSANCTGRIVYRMPIFMPGAIPLDLDELSPYQVSSVTLNLHIERHTYNTVIARPLTSQHTFSSDHIVNEELFTDCVSVNSPKDMTYVSSGVSDSVDLNITAVVRAWLAYNRGDMDSEFGAYNPSYGLSLAQSDEAAFSAASGAPQLMHVQEILHESHVEITYGDYGGEFYIHAKHSGQFLNAGVENYPGQYVFVHLDAFE
jgi:hypothetical protein